MSWFGRLFTISVIALFLAACGKNGNARIDKAPLGQGNESDNNGNVSEPAPVDREPVPTKKKPAKTSKPPSTAAKPNVVPQPSAAQVPAQAAVAPAPAAAAPAPQPLEAAAPMAQAAEAESSKTEDGPTIVGIGSPSHRPDKLLDKGYDRAIFEGKFCEVTGNFSDDGSQCYVVFDDGKTRWAESDCGDLLTANTDRQIIRCKTLVGPFVEKLKQEKIAHMSKKKKKDKKSKGKQKN